MITQPYYSHIPNEHGTVDEYENVNQQMKESSRTNLDSMAEFRAKSDTNWLQQGEIGSEKLYTEIHEFLKNQVVSWYYKILSY